MLRTIATKIFGSRNDRILRRLNKQVIKINKLEPEYEALSDEQLRAKTDEFRERLKNGEKLENLIPEAFATVREASKRTLGMRHFDVYCQMFGRFMTTNTLARVRADKWLWAARFFRTRTLAKEAIEGGKVHMNGQKIKTSKELQVGDTLTIRQGHASVQEQKTIVIKALSDNRGNATIAATLYQETDESIETRAFFAEQRKLQNLARPSTKPDKKQRRDLHKFQNQW